MSSQKYRPEIDGLRTLAILPVLLFHAGVPGLSGGFVGVDVFFVISGFLITGIVAREVDEQRFSIIRFYERRIRRILPALTVVIAAVLVGSAWLYFPSDFKLVPRSVVATLLFGSNILFWSEASYFDVAAHSKPLLHTWSLAVEEQFYVFFPLLLVLLARAGPRWRRITLVAIFVGSLLLSIKYSASKPDLAFYMLPTRVWELIAGALLAVEAIPPVTNRRAREALALGGLAAIVWAVCNYTETTVFPGVAALLPVLGAAILIHVAAGTLVGRLLSLRPVVFVGLISYSLYLWHWPVIVFTEYATDRRLVGLDTAAAIAVSFALATLSWRYVERPFRNTQRVPQRQLFAYAGLAAASLGTVAALGIAAQGWPQRFNADALRLEAASASVSPRREECHRQQFDPPGTVPCTFGAKVTPTVMLWGDSHGVELSFALGEIATQRRVAMVSETTSSCLPVLGLALLGPACQARNLASMSYLDTHPEIRTVLMIGFWANPANGLRPGLPEALSSTIKRLRAGGRKVVLVGAIPMQPWPVPRHLAHLAQRGMLDQNDGSSVADLGAATRYLNPTFTTLGAEGVTIVQPGDSLCPTGRCDVSRNGQTLYFDRHHLSIAGARIVAAEIEPYIAPPA